MSSSARRPAQPSTRHTPAAAFEWLSPTPARDGGHAERARVAQAELASRAGLFFRLGYTVEEATSRLTARAAWEFDQASHASGKGAHRRPDTLSDEAIAKVVADTYARRPG
jgi:hypothetical protein